MGFIVNLHFTNTITLKQRILFIINPTSGYKRGVKVIKLLPKYIDINKFDYSHEVTTHAKHAIEIAKQAVIDKFDIVVAVGGDGLVNEVFQSLVNTDTAFSIIPFGSGNGIARSIGTNINIKKALLEFNNACLAKMDTVSFNGQPYLGVAGIGFDGLIAQEFSNTKKRGILSYIKIFFKQLNAFQSSKYRIISDRGQQDFDAFIVAIANTQQYGNGAFIAPKAELVNGKLDLVVIRKHPKWLLPILLTQLMTKRIHKSKYVETIRASKFAIKSSYHQAHIDGEPILCKNENEVIILPNSLNIFH